MWGSGQEPLSVPPLGGGATPLIATSSQLVNIKYHRPETWQWVLAAQLLDGPDTGGVGEHVTLTVHFDLTIGVGRSILQIPDFEVFSFNWNDGARAPVNRLIWSTASVGPSRTFTSPTPTAATDTKVDQIVAETIIANARCFLQELGGPTGNVSVQLSAMFSPRNHIRPDWFKADGHLNRERFAGNEIGGR